MTEPTPPRFRPTTPLAIEARGLSRSFDGHAAVADLTLEVYEGELFALLGPSGSGKTTVLRMIAGFERPDGGELRLWNELVAGHNRFVPPERRRVGMVFQDYALFPHMSVGRNVAYGLPRDAASAQRVEEVLALAGLEGFAERSVHELSGGEQQRVALARALAPRPRLLLLDEPFSNLDATLRASVRTEVRSIVKQSGITALLVTHDQEEALSVADHVGFMWGGRLEQSGTPDEVYSSPATLHVAQSIGDPNVLSYPVLEGRVQTPFGEYDAPRSSNGGPAGGRTPRCTVVLRPEDLQIMPGGLPGEVTAREYYGHDQVLLVRLADGTEVRMRVAPHERFGGVGPIVVGLRRDPLLFAAEDA